jgi:hypothetical protein
MEHPADLRRRDALGNQLHDLLLAVAEERPVVDGAEAYLSRNPRLELGGEHGPPTGHCRYGVTQLSRVRVLGQVAGCTLRDRGVHDSGFGLGSHDQHPSGQAVAAHRVQDLLGGHSGQRLVDYRDVRPLGADHGKSLAALARLGDELELRPFPDGSADCLSVQGMAARGEHPHSRAAGRSGGPSDAYVIRPVQWLASHPLTSRVGARRGYGAEPRGPMTRSGRGAPRRGSDPSAEWHSGAILTRSTLV